MGSAATQEQLSEAQRSNASNHYAESGSLQKGGVVEEELVSSADASNGIDPNNPLYQWALQHKVRGNSSVLRTQYGSPTALQPLTRTPKRIS